MKKALIIVSIFAVLVLLSLGGCQWFLQGVPNGVQDDGSYDPGQDERPRAAVTISLPGSPEESVRAADRDWSIAETTHYGVWAVEHGVPGNAHYFLASQGTTSVQFMVSVGDYEIYAIAAAVDDSDPLNPVYYITGGGNSSRTVVENQSNAVTVTLAAVDYGASAVDEAWTLTPPAGATIPGAGDAEFATVDGETVLVSVVRGTPISDSIKINMNFAYNDPAGEVETWSVEVLHTATAVTDHELIVTQVGGVHSVALTGSDTLEFQDGATPGTWFAPDTGGDVFGILMESTVVAPHTYPLDYLKTFDVEATSLDIGIEWGT